jgi:hypothetical protein
MAGVRARLEKGGVLTMMSIAEVKEKQSNRQTEIVTIS